MSSAPHMYTAVRVGDRPNGPEKRCCTMSTYHRQLLLCVFSTTFILTGSILLIWFGVSFVEPHVRRQNLRGGMKSAMCETENSTYTGAKMTCYCGKYCSSTYPCLRVSVRYSSTGYQRTNVRAVLYNGEFDFTETSQCSYKPSCSSGSTPTWFVDIFKKSTGAPGSRYPCFALDKYTNVVLKTWTRGERNILHLMLWPSLLLVAGFVGCSICVIIFRR